MMRRRAVAGRGTRRWGAELGCLARLWQQENRARARARDKQELLEQQKTRAAQIAVKQRRVEPNLSSPSKVTPAPTASEEPNGSSDPPPPGIATFPQEARHPQQESMELERGPPQEATYWSAVAGRGEAKPRGRQEEFWATLSNSSSDDSGDRMAGGHN